jgi:hypothetical protein
VHGLWIERVEGVLEREVVEGLGRIWGVMGEMEMRR